MEKTQIISHLYLDCQNEWHIQSNDDHSNGVAELAFEFANGFGMGNWGKMLGQLHDRGKESDGFQAHIKRSSGFDSNARSSDKSSHSYIGAVLAHHIPKMDQFYWLSNALASHHRGLYDTDELELVLQQPIPPEVSTDLPEIMLPLPKIRLAPEDSAHLSRMLFSCLVDADWLDTECFMNAKQHATRGNFSTMRQLNEKLLAYQAYLGALPSTPLNELRTEIQKVCQTHSTLEPGFFELTVPTGGGKTIASVIWAIHHAIRFNKKRIIIAIPFTSIIVQTAAVLKNIFGEENVIEHHSAINEEAATDKTLLACENWDAPIIVTTNVQLFESMFSNQRSVCRKLHSIVDSVLILDEPQSLPLAFLQPIVNGLKSYRKLFGISVLFCTASQPTLDGKHRGSNQAEFLGINKSDIRSIIDPSMKLHEKLRRASISFSPAKHDYTSLANELRQYDRVLCIVNTRNHALELFKELETDTHIPTYHLSKNMCQQHILQTIEEIKTILANPNNSIRVISTQLIEAGVDIDFPVVYRQFSGLDSILQAAGRCNREGKETSGKTVVFSLMKDSHIGEIRLAADTMKDMISLYPDADWMSPEIMQIYYKKLYSRTPHFDKEGIENLLRNPLSCKFEEAAKKFRLINEEGKNIIVNFGESERLIEQLRTSQTPTSSLSRRLGKYTVTVPDRLFDKFRKAGLIEEPMAGFFFLFLKSQYDEKTGLKAENEYLEQTFII